MPKLDRYLFREFAQSFAATLIVLLVVSLGGVLADLLGKIAEGRVPASLMLSQLGLRLIAYLPVVILPLALMLGLLLAFARLYRDAEMPVLAAAGIGPRRLLKPLLLLVLPLALLIAMLSLWVSPWAKATSAAMIDRANRTLAAAGLEEGKFSALANGSVA
jgi:lipopolysaccharide export system permease protein